jgi:predicted alpha/beta-hydrolase family hydrolase
MGALRFGLSLLVGCLLALPARAAEPTLSRLTFGVRGKPVSAALLEPADARGLLVVAHGQVMTLDSPFMLALAEALARRRIATLRFNFPYAEAGREQPDAMPLLVETVVAASREGEKRHRALPLLVGGKSAGAMAAAQAAKNGAIPEADGLVIVGYPLHAPGRPSAVNGGPLRGLELPILFLQGTRDPLADLGLMKALTVQLGEQAKLHIVDGVDHGFVPDAESGRDQADVFEELAIEISRFAATLAPSEGGSK